jgi:hypothetical protein
VVRVRERRRESEENAELGTRNSEDFPQSESKARAPRRRDTVFGTHPPPRDFDAMKNPNAGDRSRRVLKPGDCSDFEIQYNEQSIPGSILGEEPAIDEEKPRCSA